MRGRQWAKLRQHVLDAAGWRCERCGNGPPLEVHHIDHDRTNDAVDNLECLCTGCHLAEHDRLRDRPEAREWREYVRGLRGLGYVLEIAC